MNSDTRPDLHRALFGDLRCLTAAGLPHPCQLPRGHAGAHVATVSPFVRRGRTMTRQTDEDRAILAVVGHPDGPQYIGPRRVEWCRQYDDHRHAFRRIRRWPGGVVWTCDECEREARAEW